MRGTRPRGRKHEPDSLHSILFAWSRPIREAYGLTTGLRIALQFRQAMWAARPGAVIHVSVPDLPWPVSLRTGTSDAAVFLQVFIQRQGFFPVDGEPEFIVDAGANIGLASARPRGPLSAQFDRFPGNR